jgi:glycogen synthase
MKHLLVCREYPPAPGGGIGTYARHIAELLAERGETVHVIGQLPEGGGKAVEELCGGNLIVHRVPFDDRRRGLRSGSRAEIGDETATRLYASDLPAQGFSWLAGALAERLVDQEGIDVIEAQDYEAPLYYFQLRRALGLGAKRRPPCVVHLHSPTEFIARHNDWDAEHARWTIAKRLETYTISAADALLSPSHYLAAQVEGHFGLSEGSVEVIPYPLGDAALVERSDDTWTAGSVCYMGRMERRKGVLELLAAAVPTAERDATVRFEFVGANVLCPNALMSETLVDQLIPRRLRSRFLFHGHVDRASIPRYLKRARIAVVPSRWENFPNTCVEAMASGLPVLASPTGGMAEVIADGHTGWIAESGDEAGLAEALRRALATPPERLAEMGANAARSIRAYCDNRAIVERQLRFRGRVVDGGARRSVAAGVEMNASAALALLSEHVLRNGKRAGRRTPYAAADSARDLSARMRARLAAARHLVGNPDVAARVWKRVVAVHFHRAGKP